MNVLVSFGSSGYEGGLRELGRSALPYFDEVRLFNQNDIEPDFREENRQVFSCARGFGYWLWKPYFLLRVLADLEDGDLVFYSDALVTFVDSPAPLFDLCSANEGIMLFHQRGEGHRNVTYTKTDCFTLMDALAPTYRYGDHLNAAFQIYRKTPTAVSFLQELLAWNRNFQVVSDAPSTTGIELPGFVAHRHDQSILSILAIRRGLRTFKDPSQWGCRVQEHPEYRQIVNHHRNRCVSAA